MGSPGGSPRQQSPREQRVSPDSSPRQQAPPIPSPEPPPVVEETKPAAEVQAPSSTPVPEEVTAVPVEPVEALPAERKLIRREVVRVEAAWLKRKKGHRDSNPRGFKVVCTLTGAPDPAQARKGVPKPPPLVKDQREPPQKSFAVDVKEYPDAYMFVADVPGLKSTDIKIDVVNDVFLIITCGRSRDGDEPDASYISLERTMGKFVRKFQLPANSDLDAMKAGCQDGVLTVYVPMFSPEDEHVPRSFDVTFDRRKSR